ncbi:MAG: DUF721 domain-containing protein [Acidobacteria bacterium]|nr:DUF721 domain-containing protein [Acidobacteriota bacterium]
MNDDGFVPLRGIRLGPVRTGKKASPTGMGIPPLALMQAWSEVVHAPLSEHARPTSWRSRVLVVEVDEPRWRNTLERLELDLRAQLNAWLGCDAIGEVRIVGRERTRD